MTRVTRRGDRARSTDIDEARNRVVLRFESERARRRAEGALPFDVPIAAVVLEAPAGSGR